MKRTKNQIAVENVSFNPHILAELFFVLSQWDFLIRLCSFWAMFFSWILKRFASNSSSFEWWHYWHSVHTWAVSTTSFDKRMAVSLIKLQFIAFKAVHQSVPPWADISMPSFNNVTGPRVHVFKLPLNQKRIFYISSAVHNSCESRRRWIGNELTLHQPSHAL